MAVLHPLRAPDHREALGAEFGLEMEGGEPRGLNYFRILADPKLAYLAREVYEETRRQFAADGTALPAESEDDQQYRLKLERWADVLEIMLEEVLEELARLKPAQPLQQEDLL
ncbi:MAG: hypothetical protein JJT81_00075 [Rubellimicrobium sp.]|jgi:hypothetical protein|nr:hypothetical protein [Rubellimicrobium sp.]